MKADITVRGEFGPPRPVVVPSPVQVRVTQTDVTRALSASSGHRALQKEHLTLAAEAHDDGDSIGEATHRSMAATHDQAATLAEKILASVPKPKRP
jgi:hypothetical protein